MGLLIWLPMVITDYQCGYRDYRLLMFFHLYSIIIVGGRVLLPTIIDVITGWDFTCYCYPWLLVGLIDGH